MANCSIVSFLDVSHPEIRISDDLLSYISEIVRSYDKEVSWIMEVEEKENFVYEIQKVFIPFQEVNSTTTEFTGANLMELCQVEPDFSPEKWRGWGHSHVDMSTNPSDQDKKQMIKFSESCEFFVGMIHNKKGDIFCWLIDNKRKIFFKDVYLNVLSSHKKGIESLLKERVTILKPQPKSSYNHKYNNYFPPMNTQYGNSKTIVGGYEVKEVCKKVKGRNVYGFEIEGTFYPKSDYTTMYQAVNAHVNTTFEEGFI